MRVVMETDVSFLSYKNEIKTWQFWYFSLVSHLIQIFLFGMTNGYRNLHTFILDIHYLHKDAYDIRDNSV